jgi:hypothetical protein
VNDDRILNAVTRRDALSAELMPGEFVAKR